MKKLILTFAIILSTAAISTSAFAASDYKITAKAHMINMDLRIAEVCGIVTGPQVGGLQIVIIADPGKYEGKYSTHTAPDGRFCDMAHLRGGRYSVLLITPEKNYLSEFSL